MDSTLQQLCEFQLQNEGTLRDSKLMQGEEFTKMGALICTSDNITPDVEKLKACYKILKQKTKKLSEFQSSVSSILIIKMSMCEDPESYIDGVISIYNKFIEGKIFSSMAYVLAAMSIYDRCLAKNLDKDTVTANTIEAFEKLTKGKKTADVWYMPYAVLLATGEKDIDDAVKEIDESSKILKKERRFPGEIAIPTAILLTYSSKPIEEKINDFCNIYEGLKNQKSQISASKAMSIYALFVDLDIDRDTLINSIAEASAFFKGKKGYGKLSGTDDLRKSIAASLVIQDYMKSDSDDSTEVISAIVVEEIISVLMITYLMIFTMMII